VSHENAQKALQRLRKHSQAALWMREAFLHSDHVTRHFALGLAEPYYPKGAVTPMHSQALCAPLLHRDGIHYSKWVMAAMPGITIDNRRVPKLEWSSGAPQVYYSGLRVKQRRLFVCPSLMDLWTIWDRIYGTPLIDEVLLVCSTDGPAKHPAVWADPSFWEQWEHVYLGHFNDVADAWTGVKAGDEDAKKIARLADREMKRVWPIQARSWAEYFRSGKTADDFRALLEGAYSLSLKDLEEAPEDSTGIEEANPIDIAGGFHNGYLYEVSQAVEKTRDDELGIVQRKRTIVVRSDGTKHTVKAMPAPKGTPAHELIYRLWPDGSQVSGPLTPRPWSTWKLDSVEAFLQKKGKYPPLVQQIERIKGHLRASVWLPHDVDYTLLALTVVVTYVQRIFESVPLLLVVGAPGTGKTQLGIAMTNLCANSPGTPVGQISAASIARLIDQTRGFVVLDDLESVGNRRGGDNQFDELVQALKLSYNQKSAVKWWTNMKTGTLERLNFYGVKMIGNTRGVDSILGSRMFTIATRVKGKVDPELERQWRSGLLSPAELVDLRNELHTWAFTNVAQIHQTYQTIFPNPTTRADEISAPLRVIAALAGSHALDLELQQALERQSKLDVQPESPDQVLREALVDIVTESVKRDGVLRTVVTVTEVMMRMALLVDPNFRKSLTTELSEIESPEWIGRQLRQRYADADVELPRTNLYGKYLRSYQLSEEFLAVAAQSVVGKSDLDELPRSTNAKDFCRGCAECPYRNACEIRVMREAKEPTRPRLNA
jgi:hypothetical protein